jgi:four helix bundle protein
MQDHRRLKVWHKAERLALAVIGALPPARCRLVPGLRSQAIRAAASIADLIAEGCGKEPRIELARFSDMALGSSGELRNQILRAMQTGIISRDVHAKLDAMIDEVRRMLTGLTQAIRREVEGTSPTLIDCTGSSEGEGEGEEGEEGKGAQTGT